MAILVDYCELICIDRSDDNSDYVFHILDNIGQMYIDYHGHMAGLSDVIDLSYWLRLILKKHDKNLIRGTEKISKVIPQLSVLAKKEYEEYIQDEINFDGFKGKLRENKRYDLGWFSSLEFEESYSNKRGCITTKHRIKNKRYTYFHKKIQSYLLDKYHTDGVINILNLIDMIIGKETLLFWYLYQKDCSNNITKEEGAIILDFVDCELVPYVGSTEIKINHSESETFVKNNKEKMIESLTYSDRFKLYLVKNNKDINILDKVIDNF
ncbi:hypothetical protein [Psychrobacter sp. I-STPA6b]|uniref:hypothetical protein n=1 Tax=Psychrobacter sp. I-STPA6b TaxID=2585718 RepID=UPI001D0CC1A1|nr:hypothetical protein [Psychrobacter sp. I-STPA6b]